MPRPARNGRFRAPTSSTSACSAGTSRRADRHRRGGQPGQGLPHGARPEYALRRRCRDRPPTGRMADRAGFRRDRRRGRTPAGRQRLEDRPARRPGKGRGHAGRRRRSDLGLEGACRAGNWSPASARRGSRWSISPPAARNCDRWAVAADGRNAARCSPPRSAIRWAFASPAMGSCSSPRAPHRSDSRAGRPRGRWSVSSTAPTITAACSASTRSSPSTSTATRTAI